jgi:hypothetical protein
MKPERQLLQRLTQCPAIELARKALMFEDCGWVGLDQIIIVLLVFFI